MSPSNFILKVFLDMLSRFFQRWKNTTHMAQHRRYILQQKEEENKNLVLQKVGPSGNPTILSDAFDHWYEAFPVYEQWSSNLIIRIL